MWKDTRETLLQDIIDQLNSLNADRHYKRWGRDHQGNDPGERRGHTILKKIFKKYKVEKLSELTDEQIEFEKQLIYTTTMRGVMYSPERL